MRTILTVGSFAVALFLFCLLVTIRAAFTRGVDVAGADRLLVINKVSLIQPLPIAYKDRILRQPGVKEVTFANWFGGVYQDEKNFFAQFAIDHETYRTLYDEFLVPDDQWQAFLADKQGAVVGKATADRFGFKVGDRVPIKGAIFPGDWEFNVRGIYTGAPPQRRPHAVLVPLGLPQGEGAAVGAEPGGLVHRRAIAPGADAVQVAKGHRRGFANSAWETRTQPESAFMASFVEQMGNIEFLMGAIGSVVFFTLLLVTGNTMAISVRERTGELAVLKTVGFGDRSVLALVLAESLLVALLGGALGIGAGQGLHAPGRSHQRHAGQLLPAAVGDRGRGARSRSRSDCSPACCPPCRAMRLQVVEALRRV